MRCKDLMKKNLECGSPQDTVQTAAESGTRSAETLRQVTTREARA